jgi:predicted glycosyltransferase
MKIAGIFRGFPGLGRVVAGVEILEYFKINFGAIVRIFSYLQGEEYLKQKGYSIDFEVQSYDYSSIGIIPISSYGEHIINQISEFEPDIIIVDGEPLMVQSLKLTFQNTKIVSLLNPFDIENPYNQPSSSKYLRKLYSYADITIVHGLWKVQAPEGFKNFYSVNTIIRTDIISMTLSTASNKISCILGGGTVNSKNVFLQKSESIVSKCVELAEYLPDYEIHIFCGSSNIAECVNQMVRFKNVIIHSNIESSKTYYADSNLIITRAGRNTLSEILFLGIPAIVIPTGCNFRSKEQLTNIQKAKLFSEDYMTAFNEECDAMKLSVACKNMMSLNKCQSKTWNPGNTDTVEIIINKAILSK